MQALFNYKLSSSVFYKIRDYPIPSGNMFLYCLEFESYELLRTACSDSQKVVQQPHLQVSAAFYE